MGRTAQISRAAILSAGLAIADEQGLPAVTMQAVAGRLRVTPMALYRHVANKDDLLDGLVERLLTDVTPGAPSPAVAPAAAATAVAPAAAATPWHRRLAALAHGIREAAARHPAVFPLLLSRPARTGEALDVRESVYSALREAGVTETRIARVERLVSTAILGFAASEAAGRFARHPTPVRDADFVCLLDWLRRMIDDAVADDRAM